MTARALCLMLSLVGGLAACEERAPQGPEGQGAGGVLVPTADPAGCPEIGALAERVELPGYGFTMRAPEGFEVKRSSDAQRAQVVMKRMLPEGQGALTLRLLAHAEPLDKSHMRMYTEAGTSPRGPINAKVGKSSVGEIYLTDQGGEAIFRTFAPRERAGEHTRVELVLGAGAARACHAPLVSTAQKMMLSLERKP